jgi:hypothetical protein
MSSRAWPEGACAVHGGYVVRAALLTTRRDIIIWLQAACDAAGISIELVYSRAALTRYSRDAHPGDLLVVDGSAGGQSAVELSQYALKHVRLRTLVIVEHDGVWHRLVPTMRDSVQKLSARTSWLGYGRQAR